MRLAMREKGIQANFFKHTVHVVDLFLTFSDLVDFQTSQDRIADRFAGVEGRIWVLENYLHIPPHDFKLFGVQFVNIIAIYFNRAAGGLY
jgi:hypothetical protein